MLIWKATLHDFDSCKIDDATARHVGASQQQNLPLAEAPKDISNHQ